MATIYVGSARISENGNAGWDGKAKAGDQTGSELSQQKFYVSSKGWYIIRPRSVDHANRMAQLMIQACANNHIGYDQSQRDTLINEIKSKGYQNISQVTKDVETDCSALVRVCVLLATNTDVGNIRTVSMPSTFAKFTNLFEPKVKYVSQAKTPIYNGDILVTCTSGHTVIVTSGNPRKSNDQYVPPTEIKGNPLVLNGQIHSINFTGHKIEVDGICGNETKKQAVRVLQTAMNKDYHSNLVVDGEWGPLSDKSLKGHYVEKGETQYLVTAVEILAMLYGLNPNGVEAPGIFGSGLAKAIGKNKITCEEIKKLAQISK